MSKQYIKKVDFLTLRANVHFNFRQSSIVQVVLRRVRTFDKLNGAKVIPEQVVDEFCHWLNNQFE